MNINRKVLIGAGIAAGVLAIIVLIVVLTKDKTVVFQKDQIENEQIWTEFKETAAQKKTCKVSIKIGDNDKYERTLEYDGNSYTYRVGNKTVKNVFLIDVKGKSDKSDKEQGYIALAGHNFTFEEITKVIYSSDSTDNMPFYLIHCY